MSVIPFARPTSEPVARTDKRRVWCCTRCDGQMWYIVEGGEIHCYDCGNVTDLRHFDPAMPA